MKIKTIIHYNDISDFTDFYQKTPNWVKLIIQIYINKIRSGELVFGNVMMQLNNLIHLIECYSSLFNCYIVDFKKSKFLH